jgi:hypothetical protein
MSLLGIMGFELLNADADVNRNQTCVCFVLGLCVIIAETYEGEAHC